MLSAQIPSNVQGLPNSLKYGIQCGHVLNLLSNIWRVKFLVFPASLNSPGKFCLTHRTKLLAVHLAGFSAHLQTRKLRLMNSLYKDTIHQRCKQPSQIKYDIFTLSRQRKCCGFFVDGVRDLSTSSQPSVLDLVLKVFL